MARVKTLSVKHRLAGYLGKFPSFNKTGSIAGMKKQFYGQNALLVRCGSYIYNVSAEPLIYHNEAH